MRQSVRFDSEDMMPVQRSNVLGCEHPACACTRYSLPRRCSGTIKFLTFCPFAPGCGTLQALVHVRLASVE